MRLKWMINFINILKVGYKCRKKKVNIKYISLPLSLLNFFYQKGLIESWNCTEMGITVNLRYINNKPIFNKIKIISTSGFRVYMPKKKNIKFYKDNVDIILNTSKGLLTLKEAEIVGIGGEVFFIIYY